MADHRAYGQDETPEISHTISTMADEDDDVKDDSKDDGKEDEKANDDGASEFSRPPTRNVNHSGPYFLGGTRAPSSKKSLPPFLQHLKRPKDLKVWFRCSLTAWVATLFIFINPTLHAYGQGTFFGGFMVFIAPPSGVFFIGLLGSLTSALGMCCAWAWGVITMKAALATRSTAQTNALLANIGQQVSTHLMNTHQATGQSTYSSELIFNGAALDARVVITYFCMLGLFVYLVARLKVAVPKLVLFEIFALVIADLFFTIAPLLPTFSGTVPTILVEPAVTSLAISIVTSMFVFPESTSHAALEGYEQILSPMKGFLEACLHSFHNHPIRFDVQALEGTRAAIVGANSGVDGLLSFLPLDWSVGRWNAEDVAGLKDPLRQVIIMFLGLLQLQVTTTENKVKSEWLDELQEKLDSHSNVGKLPPHGHHQLLHHLEAHQRAPRDGQNELLSKSMRALADSSNDILVTSGEALDAIIEAINFVNTKRWFGGSQKQSDELRHKHQVVLHKLEVECRQFAALNREHLLDPHAHLFDDQGQLKSSNDPLANPVRSLLVALVFEERMLGVAHALHAMLEKIIQLEDTRTKTQFWPPSKLRHAATWAFGHQTLPTLVPNSGDEIYPSKAGPEQAKPKKKRSKKDAKSEDHAEPSARSELEALHVQGGRQRKGFNRFIVGAIEWFTSTEGIYALRILVVTIAVSLPAVIRSSSGFYYREKGLWALIMSQTGMATFTADFLYGLLSRFFATIFGASIGMAAWYIGAGSGPGNPYGMAAITAVVIIILMYGRLFAPPQYFQAAMLSGLSFYLVIGYSWDDTHIPNYGNPGVGYEVFWRRLLLVIVGFGAAAIVTLFPKPPSATRDIAHTLAANIRSSKDLYALLLNSWSSPPKDLKPVTGQVVLRNAGILNSLPGRIALLRFEFTTSNLDPGVLHKTRKLCLSINANLSQLFTYIVDLPPDLKARFIKVCAATDDRFVGDIMAVMSLLEQALKTGDPLPAVLPTPLMLRMIDYAALAGDRHFAHAIDPRGGQLAEGHNNHEILTLSMVRQADFRKYCTIVNAYVGFLGAIDELAYVLKGAVGEEHVVPAWERGLWSRGEDV